MTAPLELDTATHEKIKAFCSQGDVLANKKHYKEAISEYNKAWKLVPDPKSDWQASTWILAAIADAAYLGGFLESARDALQYAMSCPGGLGNPFLHLRFGQLHYDKGELDRAADELMRAYMGAGEEIFEAENEKYLSFLRTRAIIPPVNNREGDHS